MIVAEGRSVSSAVRWHPVAPLVLALIALLVIFRDTAAAMVEIWSRSGTFTHAFLVPPIVLWLIWRERSHLADLPLRESPPWLVPISLVCLLWLLGELIGINAATQFALVALIVLVVPALLGWPAARRLAFPLLFLFFSVPMGEFLVEPMMERTADFTVMALRLSGIPVYREGLQFVIPTGNWSVVEACSGVRYLIASLMVGTLFAYLNFSSPWRRGLFVVISVVVPVVANWLRAYMIVMLGHYSGNALAVGVDHLIYGWLFFGVVIGLMFVVGARFADAPDGRAPVPSARLPRGAAPGHRQAWLVSACVVALALASQALFGQLGRSSGREAPRIELPDQLASGWAASEQALSTWQPAYQNLSATATRTYRSGDAAVSVWVGFYRDQDRQRKLITSTNVLVEAGSSTWLPIQRPARELRVGGRDVVFRSAELRTPADPKVAADQRLCVLQVYRLSGRFVSSDIEARLRLAVGRLLGRGDDGAVLVFYSAADDHAPDCAVLRQFVASHVDAIAATVDAAGPRSVGQGERPAAYSSRSTKEPS